jgi:hypothetical protein
MAYKLIIEPTESPDEVFVTFLPSDRTPEALAAEMAPRMVPAIDPKSFVYLPLAEYPAKKRLRWKEQFNVDSGSHDGRHITVHLELFREPLAAQEQMDRLRARSQARLSGMFSSAGALPVGSSLPPKADFQGEPRDFTADDFELSLMAPVATLNGKQYPASGQASGSIVWIYVPEHGRFILSLAPHPELGFKLAGKFQASSFRLTVDAGQLDIVAARTQFSSTSVFNVYVLLDPGYVPTSSRDVGRAVAGSVSLKELQLLRESPGK